MGSRISRLSNSPVPCINATWAILDSPSTPPSSDFENVLPEIFLEIVAQLLKSCKGVREYHKELRIISHVCRSWRVVVTRTSNLWRTIYVPLSCTRRKRVDLTYMETCIQRAGDRRLRIVIDTGGGHAKLKKKTTALEMKLVKRVMRTLVIPHMSRWEAINIRTRFICSLHAALYELVQPTDALKVLSTSCAIWTWHTVKNIYPPPWYPMFPPTFKAPKLQRLKLCPTNGYDPSPVVASLQEQFPELQELLVRTADRGVRNGFFSTPIDVRFMQDHRSIRVLRLQMCRIHTFEPIDLPNLTLLSLTHVSPFRLFEFFQQFTAPLLNQLELSEMIAIPFVPILGNTSLAWRFPLLSSLVLKNVKFTMGGHRPDSMDAAIGNLDFCQTMCIESIHGTGTLLQLLSAPHGGRWACCNLKNLTVVSGGHDAKSLRELVEARNGRASLEDGAAHGQQDTDKPVPLSEVHFHTGFEAFPEELEWFETQLEVFTWTRRKNDV